MLPTLRYLVAGLALLALAPAVSAAVDPIPLPAADARAATPTVQVALLLDNSGSMEGLINQARSHLWDLVNRLSLLRRDGQRPRIEVALYAYGDVPGSTRVVLPFTSDLDQVSGRLFAIGINGGDEYCGAVIRSAVAQLEWKRGPGDLRMIVIAGNEPFTQGTVPFREACRDAVERGITVSTVHCGNRDEAYRGQWDEGARVGGGSFTCIDQNHALPEFPWPRDRELRELNVQLNGTFLFYGENRAAPAAAQVAEDANASSLGGSVYASRAAVKSTANYQHEADLVSAVAEGRVVPGSVPAGQLPEPLQGLDPAAQRQVIAEKQAERTRLQHQIAELTREREAFVAAELAKLGSADSTLADALRQSVDELAERSGYSVGAP